MSSPHPHPSHKVLATSVAAAMLLGIPATGAMAAPETPEGAAPTSVQTDTKNDTKPDTKPDTKTDTKADSTASTKSEVSTPSPTQDNPRRDMAEDNGARYIAPYVQNTILIPEHLWYGMTGISDIDVLQPVFTALTPGAPQITSDSVQTSSTEGLAAMYEAQIKDIYGEPAEFPRGTFDYKVTLMPLGHETGKPLPESNNRYAYTGNSFTMTVDAGMTDPGSDLATTSWKDNVTGKVANHPTWTVHLATDPIAVPTTVTLTHHGRDTSEGETVIDLYRTVYGWDQGDNKTEKGWGPLADDCKAGSTVADKDRSCKVVGRELIGSTLAPAMTKDQPVEVKLSDFTVDHDMLANLASPGSLLFSTTSAQNTTHVTPRDWAGSLTAVEHPKDDPNTVLSTSAMGYGLHLDYARQLEDFDARMHIDLTDARPFDVDHDWTPMESTFTEHSAALGIVGRADLTSDIASMTQEKVSEHVTYHLQSNEGAPAIDTTAKAGADGRIVFQNITIPASAISDEGNDWTYTITQEGTMPGLTTDGERTRTIHVHAIKDHGIPVLSVDGNPVDGRALFTYTNTYQAPAAKLSPTVSTGIKGRTADAKDKATYHVTITGPDGTTTSRDVTGETPDGSAMTASELPVALQGGAGAYRVQIRQQAGERGGVTYDSAVYTWIGSLSDAGDGTWRPDGVWDKDGSPVQGSDGTLVLPFINTYQADATVRRLRGLVKRDIPKGGVIVGVPPISDATYTISADDGGPMPERTEAHPNDDGDLDFGSIPVTASDLDHGHATWRYTITRTADTPGITHDPKSDRKVTLEAKDDGEGHITTTMTGDGVPASDTKDQFIYEDKLTADPIEVTGGLDVTLTGRNLEPGERLVFTATGEGTDPLPGTREELRDMKDGDTVHRTQQVRIAAPGTYRWCIVQEHDVAERPGDDFNVWMWTVTVKDENGTLKAEQSWTKDGKVVPNATAATFTVHRDAKDLESANPAQTGDAQVTTPAAGHQDTATKPTDGSLGQPQITPYGDPGKLGQTGTNAVIPAIMAAILAMAGGAAGFLARRRHIQ